MTTAVVNPFWQLPVAPQPPNDPTFWLLNGRVGWQAAELDNVSVTDDRLGLLVVPGSGRLLTESSGSFGSIVSPGNVAVGPDQSIYLLDCTAGKLKKFDGCSCQFLTVPCLGGIGTGPRQVQSPHGIGISSGNLFICDTGNHRLLVFSLFGMVLRDIWTPPASTGLPNVWQPFAIAFDNRGHAYVSDPANGVIHRFHPTGRYEGFLSGFGAISWITFDCRNQLYSISQGQTTVTISGKDGKKLGTASRPEEIAANFPPLPFTVDAHGDLNLSRLCNPLVGTGVFGPTGTPLTSPPPDPPLVFNTSGTYWSNALDSEIYRCQWHRIVLHGNLPRKTMVYISTYSSEISQPFEQIQALPDSSWQTNMSITSLSGEWEGLIFSGPGRYLWLRVQLSGNGTATPSISTMRIEYPRISLRRFLPAVFAEDPNGASFTD